MLDKEVLKMLPDSQEKKVIEYGLLIVSSPACYIFSFSSDLTQNRNSSPVAEKKRLQEVTDYFNMDGNKINIPISGLCITDREFTYCCCIDQQTSTGIFETIVAGSTGKSNSKTNSYNADPDVVLKFISHIVNISATYAEQRWRMPLDLYFNQPDGDGS